MTCLTFLAIGVLFGTPHPMTACHYGRECRAFQRLCERGDRLDDTCHARHFNYPASDHYAKLPEEYALTTNHANYANYANH